MTSAPARRSASGPTCDAAPLAPSTTTREPVEPVRQRGEQVLDVHLGALGVVADATDATRRSGASTPRAGATRSRPRRRRRSLWPPRARNLMPLSGIGLWRRREHDAEVGVERGGEERDRRRRQHADAPHVDAGATAARPRRRPRGTRRSRGCRGRRRRPVGRSSCPAKAPTSPSTCAAATARSSASSAVRSALARPRTPSVPNSRPTVLLPSARARCAESSHADAPERSPGASCGVSTAGSRPRSA